jgi:hypothetical protein
MMIRIMPSAYAFGLSLWERFGTAPEKSVDTKKGMISYTHAGKLTFIVLSENPEAAE